MSLLSNLFGRGALLTLLKNLGAREIGRELSHVNVSPEGCRRLAVHARDAAEKLDAGDWDGGSAALAELLTEIR